MNGYTFVLLDAPATKDVNCLSKRGALARTGILEVLWEGNSVYGGLDMESFGISSEVSNYLM